MLRETLKMIIQRHKESDMAFFPPPDTTGFEMVDDDDQSSIEDSIPCDDDTQNAPCEYCHRVDTFLKDPTPIDMFSWIKTWILSTLLDMMCLLVRRGLIPPSVLYSIMKWQLQQKVKTQ